VCDTLCALGSGGALFAKNSDRPVAEVQLVAPHPPRRPGGTLETQYLCLPDEGAAATVLARPTWLWGAEHGVSEHRVAIGNERVYTRLDREAGARHALIGMDLVRLGLERSRTADEALEVMTELLGTYGQGGIGDTYGDAYFSSFLIVDPSTGWILETAGREWVAKPVTRANAISNRLCVGTDWTRASPGIKGGEDFDTRRDVSQPTGHADRRLRASADFLAGLGRDRPSAAQMAGHLRDHGDGPWGRPGQRDSPQAPPPELLADFSGISVCMHIREYMATTSSMIVELPELTSRPARAWVAPGSPCVSVFVPVFPRETVDGAVASALRDESLWRAASALRERVERDPEAIAAIRAELDPLETELWQEADEVSSSPGRWRAAAESWGARTAAALTRLARNGSDPP
jgi:secernin